MANESTRREWPALIVFLVAAFAAAGFGSQFAPDQWYRNLEKPSFNPPDAVFGPVWSVLYVMMGVAAWLVWRQREHTATRAALACWGIQLVLNGVWSWLFFGRHEIGIALAEMALLWIAILATTVLFRRISRPAAALLLPYLGWVSFAIVLNAALWRLNR
ncbi:MAG: tryptophan-rich sensory protein [Planctomycetota bacterium]|nr:MAG: tryptophan-rich sensory protein [Planctomycetota bacterium]REJ86398.1 MAG: tryptophan-rich sensory protein [Planctomycetota bacterium]REK30625.1 MAG: tryptophan-rich sensory protein [Planctomycetota bacterium]REK32999.1 MAG: tryptophan-rich sensory protein [Planctomycetota bacterium]